MSFGKANFNKTGFNKMLSGAMPPEEIAATLTRLHEQGETTEDIIAAVRVMREAMSPVQLPEAVRTRAIDVCGTGGSGLSTLNVSTTVGLVVAAAGVPVAKHGNRAQSSKSGSADLLETLGIDLALDPAQTMREVGLCFMFAQNHHPAMKYVAPVRKALPFRTIFNLVGPLCNPAGVRHQLLGVFDEKWLEPMAAALGQLGSHRAWLVCGKDGMDEITLTDQTAVVELKNGTLNRFDLDPEALGFTKATAQDLIGGSVEENATALQNLLAGAPSAYRDIVLLNSAAALVVAEAAENIAAGVELATTALDKKAAALLQKWINLKQ